MDVDDPGRDDDDRREDDDQNDQSNGTETHDVLIADVYDEKVE